MKNIASPGFDLWGHVVIESNDGNLLLAGSKADSCLLIKADYTGNIIWQRSFSIAPSGKDGWVTYLDYDSNGYLIGTGLARGLSGFTYQGIAFKYDVSSNQMLWTHLAPDGTQFKHIAENPTNGNYVITGNIYDAEYEQMHMELNASTGARTGIRTSYRIGTLCGPTTVQVVNNELYTLGGYSRSANIVGTIRPTLLKMDMAGNVSWTKMQIKDPVSATARIYPGTMIYDGTDFIATSTGDFNGASADWRPGLHKFDTSGIVAWAKYYDVQGFTSMECYGLAEGNGSYYMLAFFQAPDEGLCLISTDLSGNVNFAKRIVLGADETERTSQQLLVRNDHLYIMATSEDSASGDKEILFMCMPLNGDSLENCEYVSSVTVAATSITAPYTGAESLITNTANPSENLATPSLINLSATDAILCSPPVAVDDALAGPGFRAWPNPAEQFISIENTGATALLLDLYDTMGKVIGQWEVGARSVRSFDIRDLSKGVYYLRSADGRSYKFIHLSR